MNAAANVYGASQNGIIRFLVRNDRIVGVWVKSFPENATKRAFLSMYCTVEKQKLGSDAAVSGIEAAHNSAPMGRFEIYRDGSRNGFNIRFL